MKRHILYVRIRTFLFLAACDRIGDALDDLLSFVSLYQRLGAVFLVTIHRHDGGRILLFILLKPELLILIIFYNHYFKLFAIF